MELSTVEDARASIRQALEGGPYAHNMASAALRWVAKKYGKQKANQLVREFKLDDRFGISEEP